MSENNKTVVLGIQYNYRIASSVLIKSLQDNNPKSHFDIYILTDCDLSKYFSKLETETCKIYVVIIDVKKIQDVDCGRFGIGTLYRLLMDKYLPQHLEKVLYLDSDIIINGNIDELYDIQFDDDELVAAVECSISKKHLKNLGVKSNKIFNAGVILFNFTKACEFGVFSKACEYVIKGNTSFNDQDALNSVLDGKVKYIEPKWNYEFFRAKRDLIFKNTGHEDKVIIHFTGRYKPWDFFDINPYSYLYNKYYEQVYGEGIYFSDISIFMKIKKKIIISLYKYRLTSLVYVFIQNMFRTRT